MNNYPFSFDPKQPFVAQASDWIADVFYEILPEAGFEIRDEQIFMAFQLERAYSEKATIFAEAGVGTGKTLVYLLYAINYARYTRKPAIIACADESLIEQLIKPEGDIAKLARHLELTIDARLGKSPHQYICLNKLDEVRGSIDDGEEYQNIYQGLPDFVHSPVTMQSFYPYGNRKDYAHLSDEQWERIGWDVFQDCLVCSRRHRCGQTISREHYRKSADLIICSHDFYMEHVWTYESRKREGQLPLLPEHSSVVFDEGHLLETAAQKALTYKLNHAVFDSILSRLLQGEIRESLAVAIDEASMQSEHLFAEIDRHSVRVPASHRKEIAWSDGLLREINRFRGLIDAIEEELVFESGVYSLDSYQLKIVEEHLEMIQLALALFKQQDQFISWVMEDKDGITLVIMPKWVKQVLKEQVFSREMPVVFSSATLSVNGDFRYIAESLGIENSMSFTVASPYDYENQMSVKTSTLTADTDYTEKIKLAVHLLQQNEGRTLILFPSKEELEKFKEHMQPEAEQFAFRLLYEGDSEISHLISEFQNDVTSTLGAVTLWEGLDIPGPALSQVLVWSLPFPSHDPVFTAKRKDAADAFEEVDMPYMLLRLRQGVGRLIRSREDSGTVTIIAHELKDESIRERVVGSLPPGVGIQLIEL
ncbi:putative ATP-dependent DNA helicase YoaA [Paenibacillus plantiphilus]|uniref:ATP-dependent DNA helicase YoaA n=1 Tax=Paenibacillus plantiphilus TaxID=2905650 RepID=A0ABN8G2K7_9BACL|nr:ATP-dependent DNA helicase [Paenibacillus plantiphilus]CAH1197564.1 putative ATP-dependent DNA helicase YoaA [Paenibacillus plantiphilus]